MSADRKQRRVRGEEAGDYELEWNELGKRSASVSVESTSWYSRLRSARSTISTSRARAAGEKSSSGMLAVVLVRLRRCESAERAVS